MLAFGRTLIYVVEIGSANIAPALSTILYYTIRRSIFYVRDNDSYVVTAKLLSVTEMFAADCQCQDCNFLCRSVLTRVN